ncbi:MAG TPA: aminoacyl-tRNA hydrolase [Nitrospirota bacterium]|nr:aminoacyl-tRNA hydrolase [Nitrospirota bacterium]
MKIIIGLGNPGRKYARTRHNAGFLVLDELASDLSAVFSQEKHDALLCKARIGTEPLILAKPLTFMNDSGRAVAALLRDAYSSAGDLIVVHDDLDLPLGAVRVKIGGGHGGHNGLRSLIDILGTAEFLRIRIGINRPPAGCDAAEYVLSPFLPEERSAVNDAVKKAAEAVRASVSDGPVRAMNLFNKQ